MIVGGYALDLYCDFEDTSYAHMGSGEYPGPGVAHIGGRTAVEAFKVARTQGWKLFDNKTRALCPYCAKQGRVLAGIPK